MQARQVFTARINDYLDYNKDPSTLTGFSWVMQKLSFSGVKGREVAQNYQHLVVDQLLDGDALIKQVYQDVCSENPGHPIGPTLKRYLFAGLCELLAIETKDVNAKVLELDVSYRAAVIIGHTTMPGQEQLEDEAKRFLVRAAMIKKGLIAGKDEHQPTIELRSM